MRLSLDSHTARSSTLTFRFTRSACKAIRVLIVDADECFRNGLAENLRDDGHEACEYATVSEVPPLAALGEISAAVLDFSVASADRLALADALHRTHPTAAIIIMTAYCSDGEEAEAATRPFLHVQSRPLDYGVLHDLMHRLCGRRRY
ncbi:MAG: hypothetical protein ACHQ9S_06985 [Candidatus Binatia bacterium]